MSLDLPTSYQQVIHRSRYSRYLSKDKRRESWEETVDRLISFIKPKFSQDQSGSLQDIKKAILNLEVMPSMRMLMAAGEAATRDNIAIYNCSYLAMNNKRAFSEALYILMNGK